MQAAKLIFIFFLYLGATPYLCPATSLRGPPADTFADQSLTLYRFSRVCLIYVCVLLTFSWSACNRSQASHTPGDTQALQTRLEALKNATPDSLRPTAFRNFYDQTPAQLRPVLLTPLLRETSALLFYQLHADTLLIPFYQGLIADPQLPDTNRATAALQLASYYAHISGDPDSATVYVASFRKYADLRNDASMAKSYALSAQIAQLRGDLPQASVALFKAIQHAEKAHDTSMMARNYGNRANIYRLLEDYNKAAADHYRANAYFKKIKDSAAWLTTTGALAADYAALNHADSAQYYFTEAEKLIAAGVRQPVAEYYLHISHGGFYVNQPFVNYDSAIHYFEKAAPLATAFGDPNTEMLYLIAATRAYAQRRPVTEDARRIAAYIPALLADSDLATARDAYYTLYMVSVAEKNADEALDYYQLYDSVRTLLSNEHNRAHIASLEAQYENEKTALTIQLQEKELRQQRTLSIIFGLGALAVILTSAIVLSRIRLSRSQEEAVLQKHFTTEILKHTEAERGRIAADLHDGITHDLLNLKNNLQQPKAASETHIDSILNDIRMLSRNLHPVMLDKIGLEYSIEHLCEQIMAGGHLFASADIDYQKQLPPESELQLYRIIQESLSNVVKHAGAVAAKIRMTSQPGHLLVSVIDNGHGFDVAEMLASKNAFGLHSIVARSQAMGGRAIITSGTEGTTITIDIPTA
ncbi:MAG: sensor histidine kinase [Sphingobacteriales bacterium]|nr:MAG: sensor histidine kinase [Sphingobacteriales bacterium]